jgi:hypothetical protein
MRGMRRSQRIVTPLRHQIEAARACPKHERNPYNRRYAYCEVNEYVGSHGGYPSLGKRRG